jgi:hypothetical protein
VIVLGQVGVTKKGHGDGVLLGAQYRGVEAGSGPMRSLRTPRCSRHLATVLGVILKRVTRTPWPCWVARRIAASMQALLEYLSRRFGQNIALKIHHHSSGLCTWNARKLLFVITFSFFLRRSSVRHSGPPPDLASLPLWKTLEEADTVREVSHLEGSPVRES